MRGSLLEDASCRAVVGGRAALSDACAMPAAPSAFAQLLPCFQSLLSCCRRAADPLGLDSKLAALRIKLADIAKEHPVSLICMFPGCLVPWQWDCCPGKPTLLPTPAWALNPGPRCSVSQVEPELLHLLVLLDVRRSGAASGKGMATAAAQEGTLVLRCSVADADAVSSPWERKAEAWRKAVTAALRPLHKELQAFEASGELPGYQTSRLEQMQSDAAMLICNLQVRCNFSGAAGTGRPNWLGVKCCALAHAPPGLGAQLVCAQLLLTPVETCCRAWVLRAPPRTAASACSPPPPPSTTPAAPTATQSPWVRGGATASAHVNLPGRCGWLADTAVMGLVLRRCPTTAQL